MVLRVEAGGSARAAIEQDPRGANESAVRIAAQVAREAEVGERIPVVEAAGLGGGAGVLFDEAPHGRRVAENRGEVHVLPRDLRMRGEDGLRLLEPAGAVWRTVDRHTGGFGESVARIVQIDRLDAAPELAPRFEAIFAGDDELRVGEQAPRRRQHFSHPLQRVGRPRANVRVQILRLLLELPDVRARWKLLALIHDAPLDGPLSACRAERGCDVDCRAFEVSSALPADRRPPRRPPTS